MILVSHCSEDTHAVSETEETISFLNSSPVCGHCIVVTHESRYEHYESAFRQMEISYQPVNTFEFITGINEYICVSFMGSYLIIESCNALKSTAGRSADSYDAAAVFLGFVD